MKKLILTAVLAAATGVFAAPPTINRMPQIPPDVRQWQQKLLPHVSPSLKVKVQRAATALLASPAVNTAGPALEQAAATQVSSSFPGLPPGSQDVEAMVFLVFSQAAADEQAEVADMMTELAKMKAQTEALCKLQEKQKEEQQKLTGMQRSSTPASPKVALATAIRPGVIKAPPPLPPTATPEQIQERLDSLSEMGEMESLRLQMAMDRYSKLMSTLSNILKKLSDTASAIVQNMK